MSTFQEPTTDIKKVKMFLLAKICFNICLLANLYYVKMSEKQLELHPKLSKCLLILICAILQEFYILSSQIFL